MQTQDIQDIRGRIERFGKPRKTNNQPNDVTLYIVRLTHLVIHRPTAYFITFASQMLWQIIISPYVSELTTDF